MCRPKKVFQDNERDWVKRLLLAGNDCQYIAEEWECDITQVYRQLRFWRLDTKGNDIVKPKPLDANRKRILEFIDIRQGKTTVQDIALATKFSWEFVKEVVVERNIKLLGNQTENHAERKRQVLLVKHFVENGMHVMPAIKLAGITRRSYYVWREKFGIYPKKAPA